jgi:Reverse transcriptase (RNA-dependent DNA polymerase)
VLSVDADDVAALVTLDLSAAFDTADHAILFEVLDRRFGVHSTPQAWFQSYLSHRSQTVSVPICVCVSVDTSPAINLPKEELQGSVINPVQFIVYTEDMNTTVQQERIDLHQFADDGAIIAHGSFQQTSEICQMMEGSIVSIQDCCVSQRLQLNPDKTELICFSTKTKLKLLSDGDYNLHLGSVVMKPDSVVRDLEVLLYSELSLRPHINKIASACFYHVRHLRKLRFILDQAAKQRLVSALNFSRLGYCNSVLSGLLARIITPQHRVMNAAAQLTANFFCICRV